MRRNLGVSVLALSCLATVACASATDRSGASSEADSTGIPSYAPTDSLDSYSAKMRVSVDGAPAAEITGMCSTSAFGGATRYFECALDLPNMTQVVVSFGHVGDLAPKSGSYSCGESNGAVGELVWSSHGATLSAAATWSSSCLVAIDSAAPRAGTSAVRLTGHFDGVVGAHTLNGTFIADVSQFASADQLAFEASHGQ